MSTFVFKVVLVFVLSSSPLKFVNSATTFETKINLELLSLNRLKMLILRVKVKSNIFLLSSDPLKQEYFEKNCYLRMQGLQNIVIQGNKNDPTNPYQLQIYTLGGKEDYFLFSLL